MGCTGLILVGEPMDGTHRAGLTINLRLPLWTIRDRMIETLHAIAAKADIVLPGTAEGKILMLPPSAAAL